MRTEPETRGNGTDARDRIVRKGSGRGRRKGVVVVTGGTAGVGRATVRAFAAAGWDVGILARGRDGLRGTAREVERMGQAACAVPTDVADADQVETAAAAVEAELGAIDVWVNNAMTTVFAPVHAIDPAEFERATRVTYLGSVWGTMTALRRMRPRNHGVICQVGSALSYRSIPLQAPYCGAKAAIRGFLDSLRSELIHDGVDVDITLVHLPAVNTPQFDWCRARLPNRPQPVPPIYQPEVAADAIVWAAEHPRREVWVGVPTWKTILGQRVSPPAMDRYLAQVAWDGQQTDEPLGRERPDNLFEPVPGDAGAHGAFDDRARSVSIQMEASRHRHLLAGVALAAAGALALGMRMGRRGGRGAD